MKKAFDSNVSRARPRLRLGALMTAVEEGQQEAASDMEAAPAARAEPPAPVEPTVRAEPPPSGGSGDEDGQSLTRAVKARAEQARAPRPTAAEALHAVLHTGAPPVIAKEAEAIVARATAAVLGEEFERESVPVARAESPDVPASVPVARAEAPVAPASVPVARAEGSVARVESPVARAESPVARAESPVAPAPAPVVTAHIAAPPEVIEVQTPAPSLPQHDHEDSPELRRERLRERLKAVRENPRPEPLPPTVAEAGVLAVERIATLQTELHKVKALNLALTQDLEGARRQAEKATEEARLRMEESRRLSQEMEGRVKLLADLERELAALEGERDEALLALQETRQGLFASDEDKAKLHEEIAQRDAALAESLAEEERLCAELEMAREHSDGLRRSVAALTSERDTLARQVSELTRERAELLEARKALEAVHRALSQAVSR